MPLIVTKKTRTRLDILKRIESEKWHKPTDSYLKNGAFELFNYRKKGLFRKIPFYIPKKVFSENRYLIFRLRSTDCITQLSINCCFYYNRCARNRFTLSLRSQFSTVKKSLRKHFRLQACIHIN